MPHSRSPISCRRPRARGGITSCAVRSHAPGRHGPMLTGLDSVDDLLQRKIHCVLSFLSFNLRFFFGAPPGRTKEKSPSANITPGDLPSLPSRT